jgi:hypothetical protein
VGLGGCSLGKEGGDVGELGQPKMVVSHEEDSSMLEEL